MKKLMAMMLMGAMVLTVAPMKVYAASNDDTVVDKAGDWFATLGKSGSDKDAILFQRRADRAAKRMGKAMNAEGKKMNDSMNKMFNS